MKQFIRELEVVIKEECSECEQCCLAPECMAQFIATVYERLGMHTSYSLPFRELAGELREEEV